MVYVQVIHTESEYRRLLSAVDVLMSKPEGGMTEEERARTAELIFEINRDHPLIVVEHDMGVAAASDWIIDIGPGAGDEGGKIVAAGTPQQAAAPSQSVTARYLSKFIG